MLTVLNSDTLKMLWNSSTPFAIVMHRHSVTMAFVEQFITDREKFNKWYDERSVNFRDKFKEPSEFFTAVGTRSKQTYRELHGDAELHDFHRECVSAYRGENLIWLLHTTTRSYMEQVFLDEFIPHNPDIPRSLAMRVNGTLISKENDVIEMKVDMSRGYKDMKQQVGLRIDDNSYLEAAVSFTVVHKSLAHGLFGSSFSDGSKITSVASHVEVSEPQAACASDDSGATT